MRFIISAGEIDAGYFQPVPFQCRHIRSPVSYTHLYEQEALAKKEKWRRGTFQEMSELLNKDSQDTAGLTAGKASASCS